MVKKSKETATVEEIMKKELSAVEYNDKISKLEKAAVRDKKVIAEYKEREKAIARALVLYERKIKYLKELVVEDVLELCKRIETSKESYEEVYKKVINKNVKEELETYKSDLTYISETLYEVCNKLEANAIITKKDKAFISNKPLQEENVAVDPISRFDRLKEQFNQKIGSSVLRKPGRPKKSEQSIVADLKIGKKIEKTVEEKQDVQNKLDDIFYNAPSKATAVSTIPTTADSVFDFNEALNPNLSLKDIMADLMSDKEDEEVIVHSKELEEKREEQKRQKIELLESGFIRNPVIQQKTVKNRTIDPLKKKPTFEKKFLSIQSILKDTK